MAQQSKKTSTPQIGRSDKCYIKNAYGDLIPKEQIKLIDLERNDFVMKYVTKFKAIQKQLSTVKAELLSEFNTFIQKSAERYNIKVGGEKGNVTLMSFNGDYQIKRQVLEKISFDEGLQAAKALIDECIKTWSEKSPGELRAIVEHAFKIDKEGKINVAAILSLRRLNIQESRWQQAMQAIADSIQPVATKPYLRIYERTTDGTFKNISLKLSS